MGDFRTCYLLSIRLLANYVNSDQSSTVKNTFKTIALCTRAFPITANDQLYLKNINTHERIELYNSFGALLNNNAEDQIDFSKLSNGQYYLKIANLKSQDICVQKILQVD